jgi:hypothetical protein
MDETTTQGSTSADADAAGSTGRACTRHGVLIGGTAALALAAPAIAQTVAHPDAELLAACDEFNALERRHDILYAAEPDEDKRDILAAPIEAAQRATVARLMDLRATTLAGCVGRARSYQLYMASDPFETDAGLLASKFQNSRMLGALLRDLLALGGAVA